jgi:phosphoserine aminotransferase
MTRVYNFSAGPAALPEAVLRQAADEMLDWHGSGMSVMEMSHRGKEFIAIHAEAEALLRELLAVPAGYKVLFMQGGAIGENAIVPMNLLGTKTSIDFVDTGEWSKKSIKEARKYAQVQRRRQRRGRRLHAGAAARELAARPRRRLRAHLQQRDHRRRAVPLHARHRQRAAGGRHVQRHPVAPGRRGEVRADLRRRAEEHRPGRADHRHRARRPARHRALPITPSAFDYRQQAEADSMLNTPPTYAIYIAGLVFRWIEAQGGLAGMEAHNRRKAALLYDYLDSQSFYTSPVAKDSRSLMNVPFRLPDAALDAPFLKGAEARGMVQLKGHRSVGGMRASIYNAMPIEGVQALVAYMKEFGAQHG